MKNNVKETAKKAGLVTQYLSMPNMGGPAPTKRLLLNAVVNSILLHAASIWDKAIKMVKYRDTHSRVQRQMAIRISSTYMTVHTAAAYLLAETISMDLLVRERFLRFNNIRD